MGQRYGIGDNNCDTETGSLPGVCTNDYDVWNRNLNIKANIYAISSDTHQLQFIKLHNFKHERF